MNFDPATSTLTLDLLATTGFGCVMVYLGKGTFIDLLPYFNLSRGRFNAFGDDS